MTAAGDSEGLERLLRHIRDSRGFDFTGYKRSTLTRRITKRMNDIGISSFDDYLDELEVSSDEFNALFNTILINVSSFFRDPAVWEHVARDLLPEVISGKGELEPIRMWSAGCATGEEPFTIAILLAEQLGLAAFSERVKVFATDVDEDALNAARLGAYEAKQLKNVPEELRRRYFVAVNGHFTLSKEIRRGVIFGRNDLVRDAPISRLDLVACRNTLMYFNHEMQRNIMARLYLALGDRGLLILGRSELLMAFTDGFTAENLSLRVFRKRPGVRPRNGALAMFPRLGGTERATSEALVGAFSVSPVAQLVLDDDGNVAFASTSLRDLFGLQERDIGRPLKDLEISYRPVELRSMIELAATRKEPIHSEQTTWAAHDGGIRHLEVEVANLQNEHGRAGTSIVFNDVTRYVTVTQELERSKHELETAYEELQSTVEELETTNEELQSTNEELETTNEELQSTNEELETMNEELQSSNEELETMNDELRLRTDELARVSSLVDSMLVSLGMAIAVLDTDLDVVQWNNMAKDLWGVSEHDAVGRHFLSLDIGLPVHELRDALVACVNGASAGSDRRLPARDRRGIDIICHVRCRALVDPHGDTTGAIVMMEAESP